MDGTACSTSNPVGVLYNPTLKLTRLLALRMALSQSVTLAYQLLDLTLKSNRRLSEAVHSSRDSFFGERAYGTDCHSSPRFGSHFGGIVMRKWTLLAVAGGLACLSLGRLPPTCSGHTTVQT